MENEVSNRLCIFYCYMDEEIICTSQMDCLQHPRRVNKIVVKGADALPAVTSQPHFDQRLQGISKCCVVEPDMTSLDYAPLS